MLKHSSQIEGDRNFVDNKNFIFAKEFQLKHWNMELNTESQSALPRRDQNCIFFIFRLHFLYILVDHGPNRQYTVATTILKTACFYPVFIF